jgi:hypothetical protein
MNNKRIRENNENDIKSDKNISTCYSGGAKGSDLIWCEYALKNGHNCEIMSFVGHTTSFSKIPEGHNYKLPIYHKLGQHELTLADKYVKEANISINRGYPYGNSFVNNLLRRNYYQIRDVVSVYAVGKFESNKNRSHLGIDGGTGWTCQLYIDKVNRTGGGKINLYFFNQEGDNIGWYYYNELKKKLIMMENNPPVPTGKYAGIGTRNINSEGSQAISLSFIVSFLFIY